MRYHQSNFLFFLTALVWSASNAWAWSQPSCRRAWFTDTLSALIAGSQVFTPDVAFAASSEELPLFVRPFTKLAPLGAPQTTTKTLNLLLTQLADRLSHDLVQGATNQGGYFLSGDLSSDIFRDDCVFQDPTNQVSSLSQYQNALRVLFDPSQSTIQLLESPKVSEEDYTISARIRSHGVLQFPWHPRIRAYESNILYKVGRDDGLIYEQSQTWTKSASDALRESFVPNLTPPSCALQASSNEPKEVTLLFDYVNGRRPMEYSDEERSEIDVLINAIAARKDAWQRDMLPGKWMLVYLQPGPDGGGVDRRIPFPEFPFNDSYQRFSSDSVVNTGELLGPSLRVEVAGDLMEVDRDNLQVPKRLQANINGGKLCLGESSCVSLPISGQGLFDGVYLGERLRIGQNLNGGGARVVQVRIE